MASILSNFNPSFKAHQSRPNEPKSTVFTCLSCQVAFPSSDRQRAHYRTDWHKYNLKRKVAQLTPLSAEIFSEKVLAQQALGKEELEKQGLIYECLLCKKQYVSENGYNNHIQSKKHLELEQIADEEEAAAALADDDDTTMVEAVTNGKSLFDSEPSSLATSRVLDPLVDCLFCTKSSEEMEINLEHMKKAHGFFLPDIEYLNDKEGLLKYLSMKINNEKLCLYCNGRGKEWQSVAAARAHMTDRGHCKMAYDESEDPEELLKYYDFEVNNDDMDVDSEDKSPQENELVLQSGVKLGHRKFMKYYKRNAARKTLVPESEEAQQQQQEPETLRRKERRHLAITDGKEQDLKKTAEGIKEATLSKEFSRNVAFKQNTNLRLRARNQNPI